MKKFFLSFFVIFASAGYALNQYFAQGTANFTITTLPAAQQQGIQPLVSPLPSAPGAQSTPTPVFFNQQTNPPVIPVPISTPADPSPAPAPKPQGQYVDGTYIGSSADAYYGTVQTQALIQNGKLASVQFLQYPNDRRTSQYINGQAMPILKSEAIQAQSANVDIVSGATDTSMAFQQSLGNALAQAKN